MRPLPALALLALSAALALSSCAGTRIERYYTAEDAPKAAAVEGISVKLLYYKQSMRHFYATLRVENSGTGTVTFERLGDGTGDVLLDAAGGSFIAEEPTHNTWTPWTGIVERSPDQIGKITLEPRATSEISLRWAFPTTLPNYRFDWTMRFHGLKRDGQPLPDVVLRSPGE